VQPSGDEKSSAAGCDDAGVVLNAVELLPPGKVGANVVDVTLLPPDRVVDASVDVKTVVLLPPEPVGGGVAFLVAASPPFGGVEAFLVTVVEAPSVKSNPTSSSSSSSSDSFHTPATLIQAIGRVRLQLVTFEAYLKSLTLSM